MPDPWGALRATTRARIGLGRTGNALPIGDVLDFQLAHARARDAVHTALDTNAVAQAIAPHPHVTMTSRAPDRASYLRRPDFGRQLDPACGAGVPGPCDAVFIIADGLSPAGVQLHAPILLRACIARL
ncbi:MAG TPA: ethanolamine ammonia-lyase light chain EutC, partial [Rhodopila sp.]